MAENWHLKKQEDSCSAKWSQSDHNGKCEVEDSWSQHVGEAEAGELRLTSAMSTRVRNTIETPDWMSGSDAEHTHRWSVLSLYSTLWLQTSLTAFTSSGDSVPGPGLFGCCVDCYSFTMDIRRKHESQSRWWKMYTCIQCTVIISTPQYHSQTPSEHHQPTFLPISCLPLL